jgi:hypothetical protein
MWSPYSVSSSEIICSFPSSLFLELPEGSFRSRGSPRVKHQKQKARALLRGPVRFASRIAKLKADQAGLEAPVGLGWLEIVRIAVAGSSVRLTIKKEEVKHRKVGWVSNRVSYRESGSIWVAPIRDTVPVEYVSEK